MFIFTELPEPTQKYAEPTWKNIQPTYAKIQKLIILGRFIINFLKKHSTLFSRAGSGIPEIPPRSVTKNSYFNVF